MIQAGQRAQASLTESEIDRVLRKVAIPRHWHTELIKRGHVTRYYIQVHELEEIVSAVLYNVRQDMESALVGIFRDTCPDCGKPINYTDHKTCDL